MNLKTFLFTIISVLLLGSCASSFKSYRPDKKYSRKELQSDYTLLRNILEEKHPSLYWYTSQDSMNFYFDSLYRAIPDSMTELQFGWNILAPLSQKIHCGHTSFGMSHNWSRYVRNRFIPSFPLYVKVWGDTMIVTGTLHKKDSLLKPGMQITSINNMGIRQITSKMFQYLPGDGFAENVNYLRISSNFPYFHRNVFGLYKNYKVGYIDSTGKQLVATLPMWVPQQDSTKKDSTKKKEIKQLVKIPKKERKKKKH